MLDCEHVVHVYSHGEKMKKFYSRPHALTFLDVQEATLQRAVNHGWIVPLKLGPRAAFQTEFFLRPDLVAFREKYRNGYYEPLEILKRRKRQRRLKLRKG